MNMSLINIQIFIKLNVSYFRMNSAERVKCTQCSERLKGFKYDFGLLFEDELGAGSLPVLITDEDAVNKIQSCFVFAC